MSKFILVIEDGTPVFKMEVNRTNTIRDIKSMLSDYSNIKMFLNKKDELEVFKTDKYDAVNLDSVWNKMTDSYITVVNKTARVFTQIKDVDIKILTNLSYEDVLLSCKVNKYLSELCLDHRLWRNKLEKDFPLRSKYLYHPLYLEMFKTNPQDLYEEIQEPAQIISVRKTELPLTYDFLEDKEGDQGIITELLEILNQEFDPKQFNILRGDVIHLADWLEYRNDGKYIWTGEKIIALDFSIDEYGAVPKEFTFPEFSRKHFFRSIDHNMILHLSEETLTEAVRNAVGNISTVSDLYHSYSISFWGETYEDEDEQPDMLTVVQARPYFDSHFGGVELVAMVPGGSGNTYY